MNLLNNDSADKEVFRNLVKQAKNLLPLEKMLDQLEDWDRCVAERRCPFHDDLSPSFSVFTRDGNDYWKCHAGCGAGDQINFLQIKFELTRGEALKLFLEMAGVSNDEQGGLYV
jgi:DNA primase